MHSDAIITWSIISWYYIAAMIEAELNPPLGSQRTHHNLPSWAGYWVSHDDVIKRKHFPHYWPFVPGIHRSLVNSLHKGQWHGSLMFSMICTWINGWVDIREAGDLKRHPAHYDVIVMHCEDVGENWLRYNNDIALYHVMICSVVVMMDWSLSRVRCCECLIENLCCLGADTRLAPSQWETLLQSNVVSHWLGTNLESALCPYGTQDWTVLVKKWKNVML